MSDIQVTLSQPSLVQVSFDETSNVRVSFPSPAYSSLDALDASDSIVKSTGSTTFRTLATRFAEVVNVKDFGAVGDGTTNDTTAIQAAITAASSVGDVVFFPNGTYLISSTLTISVNRILLVGQGRDNTTIKTSTASIVLVTSNAAMTTLHGITLEGDSTTTIGFLGNGTSGTGTNDLDATISECTFQLLLTGIQQAGRNLKVSDNIFQTLTGKGIEVIAPIPTNNDFRGLEVVNNRFHSINSGTTYCIYCPGTRQFYDLIVKGNYIDACYFAFFGYGGNLSFENNTITRAYAGVVFDDTSFVGSDAPGYRTNVVVGNNLTFIPGSASAVHGYTFYTGARFLVMSNSVSNSPYHGFYFNSLLNSQVIGNYVYNCALDSSGSYLGYSFQSASTPNQVIGNICYNDTNPVKMNYAFEDDAGGNFYSKNVAYGPNFSAAKAFYLSNAATVAYGDTTCTFTQPRVVYSTAVPSAGTWTIGDRAINSVPTVGQPKAWVCTVSGTSGTWVSEGNL